MYGLIDCNNFYASCERVFRPDLNGKPVVVLSNNDGCVIARSNEAKKLGIPMGAPAFQHEELFSENNVQVFSANFVLYGDMSARVMSIVASFVPDMEVYSIDEAFLLFDGFENFDLAEYGQKIRQAVYKSTGIPVSIGFAPTKALAKAANRIAKKFSEITSGVYAIDNEEKRIKALKWLPVEDVWGIGSQHALRLNNLGIKRAWDFTLLGDNWVRKNMSVVGLRLKKELEGESTLELEKGKARKNIATTRSFEEYYTTLEQLNERVVTFSVTCAEKLRKQKSNACSLMVFLLTNYHRQDLPQYQRNIVIKFPFATNSGIEIARFASEGLKKIFKEGYLYKKAGVIVMDIIPENPVQLNIFEDRNPRHLPLMKVIDRINRTVGNHKVKLASQDLNRTWKMHQERLSPRYTTRLDEIIVVKA
jgi:DNA polymerase V